jgi:hypothetical protein
MDLDFKERPQTSSLLRKEERKGRRLNGGVGEEFGVGCVKEVGVCRGCTLSIVLAVEELRGWVIAFRLWQSSKKYSLVGSFVVVFVVEKEKGRTLTIKRTSTNGRVIIMLLEFIEFEFCRLHFDLRFRSSVKFSRTYFSLFLPPPLYIASTFNGRYRSLLQGDFSPSLELWHGHDWKYRLCFESPRGQGEREGPLDASAQVTRRALWNNHGSQIRNEAHVV